MHGKYISFLILELKFTHLTANLLAWQQNNGEYSGLLEALSRFVKPSRK